MSAQDHTALPDLLDLAEWNLACLEEQRRRCIRWKKSHFEIDAAIDDTRERIAKARDGEAFIVRACNSHDDLVGALEGCIEMAEAYGLAIDERAIRARAIAAKARGQI